ncbi:MAG: nucleoside hydrolase [Betaproteobacteria bacterium]|nr:nucleoside hydrolase [Betaproteobacteria bacterium]
MKTKMLVDCDPGHDDAVALLFAAHHFDLIGVTTVHGNASLENTTRNALSVMALANIDAPLAAGRGEPLVAKAHEATEIHGKTGLDGATLPAPTRKPIAQHAVDFIIEMAYQHRGELVIALVGPETNLAAAIKREPRLASWLREITIMGGSTTTGNITPAAEFNVYCDPEAAAIVFECGAPIRMMGYNVTRETGFTHADIERLKQSGKQVAGTIANLMAFYLDRQERIYGLTVAPMHDVCALIPYVVPELITDINTSVRVELAGTHTRGMTVCDLRGVRPGSTQKITAATRVNARVALSAQSRALIDLVIDTLLAYP